MDNLPAHNEDDLANIPFHVVPDRIKGGWNVYSTTRPQEPQRYFEDREEAIRFARDLSTRLGVGFSVEENEAYQAGRE